VFCLIVPSVADIPGLIPGAHLNHGLGIDFLKHIERCVCLLYVIDLSMSDPVQQLAALRFELDQYKEGLSSRPHAIVANKIDLPNADKNLATLREAANDLAIFPISAKHRLCIEPLLRHIWQLYCEYNDNNTKK